MLLYKQSLSLRVKIIGKATVLKRIDSRVSTTLTLDNMANVKTTCNKTTTALAQEMDKSKIFKVDT